MNKLAGWQRANQGWGKILIYWLLVSVFIRVMEIIFFIITSTIPLRLLTSVLIGLIVGILQWSVIKSKIEKDSRQWIVATWAGYLLTVVIVIRVAVYGPLEQVLRLSPRFTEYDRIVVIIYLYWFVEALIVGSLQSLVISKWSKMGWRWVFILVFSITLEFVIVQSTSAMAMMLIRPSFLGLAIASMAMLLTTTLSGGGLVWLLKTASKRTALAAKL